MLKKDVKTVFSKLVLAVCICGISYSHAPAAQSQAGIDSGFSPTRVVTDMAGRKVTVPRKIGRIATIGAVPVINSYLFALGEGSKIVNGLPYFARSKRWRIQTAIAPHLANQPVLQGQISSQVNIETLIKLRPDIIITMDIFRTKSLAITGIPVIYIEWRDVSDIKANMRVLGEVLDKKSRSDEYLRYFENTMNRVRKALKGISKESMPKVLHFSPITLTTPRLIADWWIREAGGQSVTSEIVRTENITYSHERVLLWNPDILLVSSPDQIEKVYQDTKFSMVNAVRNKRVYAIPAGAHTWGARTIEQPLTVLWAAKIFYPDKFSNINMVIETQTFYKKFFEYNLTNKEAVEMIEGGSDN